MSPRNLSTLIAAVLLAACSTTSDPRNQRANTPLDTGYVVGPESPLWDEPPRLIRGKSPVYPITLALEGKSGGTTLAYTIGADGQTKGFRVVSTDDQRLADHAIIAVREWLFQPAKTGGVPIEVEVTQSFSFRTR